MLTPQLQEATVTCADVFLKNGDKNSALWAAKVFANAPVTEAEADQHVKIVEGERPFFIVGVRSQVCWLIYQLIYKESDDHIDDFIDVISYALENRNLYLRTQASVALIGLAWRRCVWVDGVWILPERVRSRIRELLFTPFRANRDSQIVTEGLVHVLEWVRDVNDGGNGITGHRFVRHGTTCPSERVIFRFLPVFLSPTLGTAI